MVDWPLVDQADLPGRSVQFYVKYPMEVTNPKVSLAVTKFLSVRRIHHLRLDSPS